MRLLKLKPLLILSTTAVLFYFGLSSYLFVGPIVAPSKVAALEIGMTRNQVRNLLGKPNEQDEDGYSYTRESNIGWVNIVFDNNGRLTCVDAEPTEIYVHGPCTPAIR